MHFFRWFVALGGMLMIGLDDGMASVSIVRSAQGGSAAIRPSGRPPVPGAPAGVTAFVNVGVIPMDTERVLQNQTILVQQGWIVAVGPSEQVHVPAGAMRIDGEGKYLIPGLAEMHGHIMGSERRPRSKTRSDSIAAAERLLFAMAADGITTVRNMNAYDPEVTPNAEFLGGSSMLELRTRAAAGEIWSPRIYTSGQWVPTRYHYVADSTRPKQKNSSTPPLDSVAAFVAAYKAAGYDFLKIRLEPLEVFDSVAAAAHRIGIPVVGHKPVKVPLERAIAGMRSIEHAGPGFRAQGDTTDAQKDAAYRAAAAAIRRAGVWLCFPNQGNLELVKYMQEAGVSMLLGTDMAPSPIHKVPHDALRSMVQVGLTPYQALAMGTKNVAEFFGVVDSSGTVAVGKRADLVLLSGNPLADIRNTREPAGVMIGGRWLDRTELDRRLAEMKASIAGSPRRTP